MNRRLISLMAVLALAACGGGGGDAPNPLDSVPDSASTSAQGLTDYLGALPPLDAEMREPLSLDNFAPRSSEDTEPHAVGG